jgi:predicted NUDIX family NTP pyrophosphohydrolase
VARTSAGILLYRRRPAGPEVLLGHMGGPFWAKKDDGGWSIPKGEHGPDEEPIAVAGESSRRNSVRPCPRTSSCRSASSG